MKSSRMKTSYLIILVVTILIILILLWLATRTPRDRTSMLTSPKVIKANSFNGTINLEWENVKDADSYNMYYSNVPNFTRQNARTIEGIKGNDTFVPKCSSSHPDGLERVESKSEASSSLHSSSHENPNVVKFAINKVPPGSYHYRIVSVKGGKESVWSEEASILVGACQLSAPPSDLKREIQENGDIKITWSPDSTADGYILHLTSEDGFEHRKIELDDPLSGEHILSDFDSKTVWFVDVASFGTHCGEGSRSLPIQLNKLKEST